jgi:hypothetical protein
MDACFVVTGCCRLSTVKAKCVASTEITLVIHSIFPTGLLRGETILSRGNGLGEWGIWSPGGRPIGAASFLSFGGNARGESFRDHALEARLPRCD